LFVRNVSVFISSASPPERCGDDPRGESVELLSQNDATRYVTVGYPFRATGAHRPDLHPNRTGCDTRSHPVPPTASVCRKGCLHDNAASPTRSCPGDGCCHSARTRCGERSEEH